MPYTPYAYVAPPVGGRLGASIADLIRAKGDIQAQRALNSGALWGNAISGVGQAIGQYQQQKTEKKQQQALSDFVDNLPDDPNAILMGAVRILGPEKGFEFGKSALGFKTAIAKMQQGEVPSIDNFQKIVQGVSGMYQKDPEYVKARWPGIADALNKAGAPQFAGLTVTPEWDDHYGKILESYAKEQKKGTEDYTLAPGAKRYGPNNQLLAENPREAPTPTSIDAQIAAASKAGNAQEVNRLLGVKRQIAAIGKGPKEPTDPNLVAAYVDDLSRGQKIWSDVPANIRHDVEIAASKAGINAPTKRPGEKTISELADAQDLMARTNALLDEPANLLEWAKARAIPNWVTSLTGWGASAKANQADFFLYMAETLKAIQGSRPSDKDMQWYMENLPKQGDAEEVKNEKINRIKSRLTRLYNNRVKGLKANGYALGGFDEIPTPPTTEKGGGGTYEDSPDAVSP